MQLTRPHACPCPRHAQARVPLVPFRLEEAGRSDKHALAACTAFAVTAVPAVLGKHDSRIARRRGSTGPNAREPRFLRCAWRWVATRPRQATSLLPEQPLQFTTPVEYAQGMISVRNQQATAATRRDRYRADPRAYTRIAAVLLERITAGELVPGHATPSITRLCADHGVARQTAAHALHVLQDAGLVYQVPGLGYHVCNDILSQRRDPRRLASGP